MAARRTTAVGSIELSVGSATLHGSGRWTATRRSVALLLNQRFRPRTAASGAQELRRAAAFFGAVARSPAGVVLHRGRPSGPLPIVTWGLTRSATWKPVLYSPNRQAAEAALFSLPSRGEYVELRVLPAGQVPRLAGFGPAPAQLSLTRPSRLTPAEADSLAARMARAAGAETVAGAGGDLEDISRHMAAVAGR